MKDLANFCLEHHNTFNISAKAKRFIEYEKSTEIVEFAKNNKDVFKSEFLVLGGGSNILFTKDYDGTIIHPTTSEKTIIHRDSDFVYVEAEAGIEWDSFVEWTIENNAYGLENLSLIPGTVGASAVQNIGAYGVEICDFIHSVEYIDLIDFEIKTLDGKNCEYEYRNSIFKKSLKNNVIILKITYKLFNKANCNLSYTDIKNVFCDKNIATPSKLRDEVISIRNSKLPNTDEHGNAGSFFKNPIINTNKMLSLKSEFEDLRYFDLCNGTYKLAAAWLIDKCGLKGTSFGNAAIHDKQALVIINKYNKSTGEEVSQLSKTIQKKVYDKFGVMLEPEVIII